VYNCDTGFMPQDQGGQNQCDLDRCSQELPEK
jgi:hypothetical protein